MGFKTIRFPNGCVADLYDWKNAKPPTVSVEMFLDFCDAVGAEPYYTLNMQGGTEGLEPPIPEDASLEERIRYRHPAPNPCGYTNYHFGTLDEAVDLLERYTIERALDGKTPIAHYELGNENWGQAKTDWPPEIYGKTCEVYARTLRDTLGQARAKHPELAEMRLYIVAVGFPTMGNNQDPFRAQDREINAAWTAEINRLGDLGLIDAVQEHFYPYGANDGSTLLWTIHNFHNILSVRHGQPNERLGGYVDSALAYHVPMEWTEWNLKCWGRAPDRTLSVVNSGFETDLEGWLVASTPPGVGQARTTAKAARGGLAGLHLTTGNSAERVEIRQTFDVTDCQQAAAFAAAVWVKSPTPMHVHGILRQTNTGENQGTILGERVAFQTDTWERLTVIGKPKPDTKQIELVLRLEGAGRKAYLDDIEFIHWPTFDGMQPLASNTFEQQLFLVDALRTLLEWPTPRTHVHHLIGSYPCGMLDGKGNQRPNTKAFQLLAGRIGTSVIAVECEVPTYDYDTGADERATDFNALAPDMKAIPALSVMATRKANKLYVLLVNRTTDRTITTRLNVMNASVEPSAELRTLTADDLQSTATRLTTERISLGLQPELGVPPHSAQVLTLDLQNARRR
jgi:alpha-L-arabinofuranosidase